MAAEEGGSDEEIEIQGYQDIKDIVEYFDKEVKEEPLPKDKLYITLGKVWGPVLKMIKMKELAKESRALFEEAAKTKRYKRKGIHKQFIKLKTQTVKSQLVPFGKEENPDVDFSKVGFEEIADAVKQNVSGNILRYVRSRLEQRLRMQRSAKQAEAEPAVREPVDSAKLEEQLQKNDFSNLDENKINEFVKLFSTHLDNAFEDFKKADSSWQFVANVNNQNTYFEMGDGHYENLYDEVGYIKSEEKATKDLDELLRQFKAMDLQGVSEGPFDNVARTMKLLYQFIGVERENPDAEDRVQLPYFDRLTFVQQDELKKSLAEKYFKRGISQAAIERYANRYDLTQDQIKEIYIEWSQILYQWQLVKQVAV